VDKVDGERDVGYGCDGSREEEVGVVIVWEMKHTSSKDKLVPQRLWLLDLNLQGRVVDPTETDCVIDLVYLWRTLIGFQGIRQSGVQ